MVEVIWKGTESYDPKKYRDDFGTKKNPFRFVALATAHYSNGHPLELRLKFTVKPDERQVNQKALRLLEEVGLI